MIPPGPSRSIGYTHEAERKIRSKMREVEGLGGAILALEKVIRRRPEDEETEAIPGYPKKRFIARKHDGNPAVPAVTLLYEYDSDHVEVWDVRIEEP